MRAARPPRGEGAVLFSLEGGRLCPAEEAAPLRSDGQYVGLYPADRLDEAALLEERPADYVRKITYIRRDLRVLKAHYEQFYSVLEGIQENENRLFGRDQMRYFKLFAGRLDRLNAEVLNLREYVTQVREAYQAQVDISMNKIMKVLTVVTAVISPLSLIAGWYGMNLQMPETSWSWGYPAVILLSLAVAGCCLAYFHKNKWL